MSTVSLIILSHNGKHFLEPCLASIVRQTRLPDELILVDNGSDDGSQEWIRINYPQVTLIEMGYNSGFSVAMNRGVAESSSDYVALLNNDTECEPQWLEELTTALDQHPDIGFCASKMLTFRHRDILDAAGDLFTTAGFGGKRGWLQSNRASEFDKPERVLSACAGAAMYRRTAFVEIGGFDEDFFAYEEDTDLSLRLQMAGYPCLYVPKAVVYHHVGGTWKINDYGYCIRLQQRNQILLLVKDLPWQLCIRFGFQIVSGHLCLFLMRIKRGYGTAALLGLWDAIRGLRAAFRKRKSIQENRSVTNAYLVSMLRADWIRLLFDPFLQKRKLRRQNVKF